MSLITAEFEQQLYKFCQKEMHPFLEEDDEKQHFRSEIYQGMANLGLAGLTTTEKWGGAGCGLKNLCRVLEILGSYSVSYGVTLSVSLMVQNIIEQWGNEEQKKTWLPKLTAGAIASFALSESHSGSDAAALRTHYWSDGDDYILNGQKMWITSAGLSEVYAVVAREKSRENCFSLFLISPETDGFTLGKKENKMGWRSSPTREIRLENCRVSKSSLVGAESKGLKLALSGLDKGRITIAALALGLARGAFREAIQYTSSREQFKTKIIDFQGTEFLLADLATEIEASAALIQQASHFYDRNMPNRKLSSMAKMKATDVAMRVTTDALQLHGGVGYTKEFPVERYMRDAKVLQIVEGSNQIQKIVIAKELKKEI